MPPAPEKSGEQALGRSRGGLTTTLHLTADALGNPVRLILTGGQAHDMSQAAAVIEGLRSDHVIADKGYDSGPFESAIEASKARAVILSRSNRREPREWDQHRFRERNQIERLLGRLKECRRVATRYEKTARNDLAFCQSASVMVLLA
jgi:transposase